MLELGESSLVPMGLHRFLSFTSLVSLLGVDFHIFDSLDSNGFVYVPIFY